MIRNLIREGDEESFNKFYLKTPRLPSLSVAYRSYRFDKQRFMENAYLIKRVKMIVILNAKKA